MGRADYQDPYVTRTDEYRVARWAVNVRFPDRSTCTGFQPITREPTVLPPRPASINDEVASLPSLPRRGDDRGRLLFLQRMGIIVIPTEWRSGGYWACIVVSGNEIYPHGGYDISVGDEEIRKAIAIDLEFQNIISGADAAAVDVVTSCPD